MRLKVSLGLFVFAATIFGVIGLAAGPALAGGSSVSISVGSIYHSGWHAHGGYRDPWRHRHRSRHHARRAAPPHYWPRPWSPPPRVVYVEPPREITPAPAPTAKPYCREFQKQIIIDGRTEQAYGVACRQPDGTWKIQP
jgi:hypothetical protein